jgi:hypothetical protein
MLSTRWMMMRQQTQLKWCLISHPRITDRIQVTQQYLTLMVWWQQWILQL